MSENNATDFLGNGLYYHCFGTQNELRSFKTFHSLTENFWSKENQNLQSEVNDGLKKHSEEYHEDIIDVYAFDLHETQSKFPSIHRESLVITIYNFLEAQMDELCSILSESINTNIELKDLQGKGITRARLYLTKVANLNLSKVTLEWDYIKNVNKLRNQIVHNAGRLPSEPNDPLNLFISQIASLSGTPGECVSVMPYFIEEFIDKLDSFFEKLNEEVQIFIQSSSHK